MQYSRNEVAELSERVRRLERQNRRMRMCALVGLGMILALGFVGAALSGPPPGPTPVVSPVPAPSPPERGVPYHPPVPSDDTIRTKRLEIVDGTGRVRASLGTYADRGCVLKMYDTGGKLRASLSVNGDGSTDLKLLDVSGSARGGISAQADGSPQLFLKGKDVTLATAFDPISRRPVIMGSYGNEVVSGVSDNGIPYFTVRGKKAEGTAHIDVWDGNPRLLLRNKRGHENTIRAE